MRGHTVSVGADEKNILFGKPEGKRPLGKPKRKWEYNIKMDRKDTDCEGVK
jgi:hypothetical protein